MDGWMWSYRTYHLFRHCLVILRDLSIVIHESVSISLIDRISCCQD
jgi:hypothetical protein